MEKIGFKPEWKEHNDKCTKEFEEFEKSHTGKEEALDVHDWVEWMYESSK